MSVSGLVDCDECSNKAVFEVVREGHRTSPVCSRHLASRVVFSTAVGDRVEVVNMARGIAE